MDSKDFLPDIDVEAGLNRLMKNKKLYATLLTKFNVKEMADELIASVKDEDFDRSAKAAHAIKGVASNLGLNRLTELSLSIELRSKEGQAANDLLDTFIEAVTKVDDSIARLLESEVLK